jgi:hypothetical protein
MTPEQRAVLENYRGWRKRDLVAFRIARVKDGVREYYIISNPFDRWGEKRDAHLFEPTNERQARIRAVQLGGIFCRVYLRPKVRT